MAVADFKPTLGMIELSTSGSILTGNNAAFCAKFLDKGVGGAPVSLESLTYVLPGQNREGEEQRNQPSVVVNLLMQLRASCDQNNFFLRTGQAAQAQVTARLHQVLGQCSGAARARAGEIERAIRTRLVQEEEFSRALRKLERELKKNNVSLNQPLPEKETGRWSGSPFRQEKRRESQTVQVPETERITLVARPSENYRENRIGQIPESMPPEARLLPQPVRAERYIYRDSVYQIPGISDENVRWTWRQVPRWVYVPVNRQMFRSVSPARIVSAREDGTVQFVPVIRREQLSGETGRTIFSVRELWTHSNNVSILGRERPVREHIAEEYTTEKYTTRDSQSLETRLLSQPVRAEQYIYRDNVYRPPEVPGSSVHGSRRQILEGNGPEIYRQLLKRSGPEIHWWTLGQAAGGLLRREFLPSVTKSSFQQAFPQYVQENFPSEPPQSGLQSLWFKLPRVSQKIWRQTTLRLYAPVNRQIFQSISATRIVPAGKDGAVQFIPALRREQLPGETSGITVSVREIRTHSNNISILDRERPVREHIAEEYTTKNYTARDGPSPEARLLSRPVRAEQYIYRDSVYRPPEVPDCNVHGSWRQILEGNGPEIYRQLLKRSGPEIHWWTLGQAAGGLLRREFLPSVTKSSFQQAFPQYVQENFPSEPPQSGLQSLWFKLPQVSQKIWRQTTLRHYAPVNRQMFRSVFPARTLPSGKDGAVRFVPVFRREQLPGKTGRIVFSVREVRTHFNNIAILDRERPVREHIAEEYTTEKYTVQNGQSPETRLLSQPAAAGRYRYLIPPWSAGVPGWRAGWLRQPKLERNIRELYRQGPVRGEGAKLILRRVVDWAKELVRGPAERTVPGRNISSGTRPEPPFSGEAELRYARSAEKRREQEPAILTRHDERAGSRRVPLWRMLRSVERGTPPELWKTEEFVRETWTKNHILYRALRQKNEPKAEGPRTLLYTERENEREAFRRNSVSEPQSPSLSPRLTHFTQPLEAAEGTMPEFPACRASEGHPSAGAPGRTEGSQAIVYRSHARPVSPAQPQTASPAAPGQMEGEDVFRAQIVSDGQVRAMEQAFSYQTPGNRREESERSGFESAYAPRAEEPINYNRLTEEILVRLERRLRAERRKFGL